MSVYFHESSVPLLVPIDQVVPYANNANNGDVDSVVESIATNGFYGAVVAQTGTGTLIAGHTRLAALLELGADQIPVFWMDVADIEAARTRIADNRTNRLGRDDPALMLQELQMLQQSNLGLLGTGTDERYMEMLSNLQGPLVFDDEGAKQRSAKPFSCPNCGWGADR